MGITITSWELDLKTENKTETALKNDKTLPI